jgi:NitT/TauT family transport system substrate-binding protein
MTAKIPSVFSIQMHGLLLSLSTVRLFVTLVLAFLMIAGFWQRAFALEGEPTSSNKIEHVRLGYSALSFAVLPLFLSDKQGFFQQENLELELIQARSNVAIAAILSGHMQFTSATVSSAAAAARGVPIKVLGVMLSQALQYVIAKPDISNPAQLKGKKIFVDSFGGATHVVINQMLRKAGLNPEKDVQILGGVDATARFAQLKSGVIDATVLSPTTAIACSQ